MIIQGIEGIVDYSVSNLFLEEEPLQGVNGGNEQPQDEYKATQEELDALEDDAEWDEVEDGSDLILEGFAAGQGGGNNDEDSDDDDIDIDFDDMDDDGSESSSSNSKSKDKDDDTSNDDTNDESNDDESNDDSTEEEDTDENSDEENTDENEAGLNDEESDDENSTDSSTDGDENEDSNDEEENDDNSNTDTDSKEEEEEIEDEPMPDELTDEELAKALAQLEAQENFGEGSIKKDGITHDKNISIEALDDAGVTMETVGKDILDYYHIPSKGINTIVIKKLSKQLMDADPFGCFYKEGHYKEEQYTENINNGIRLGTMLGRKIQIRNEERNTTFTRLNSGKIDRRLVASIGYGAEQVFSQVLVDKFNPVVVRISVDASGSMNGKKWDRTMTAVVAICKAASMVQNLDVVVDFRLTTSYDGSNKPLVIVAYDSRIDKFEKIRRLFPRITCPGTTPEGLCFEAIANDMQADKKKDQFFINFSDGEPCFETKGFEYYGNSAHEHTRQQVQLMREKGIKILSFYINNKSADVVSDSFKRMYGKDAKNVAVDELIPLAKSINSLFIEK